MMMTIIIIIIVIVIIIIIIIITIIYNIIIIIIIIIIVIIIILINYLITIMMIMIRIMLFQFFNKTNDPVVLHCRKQMAVHHVKVFRVENDVLFQKVTQAYSEKNPSAPIRSRT